MYTIVLYIHIYVIENNIDKWKNYHTCWFIHQNLFVWGNRGPTVFSAQSLWQQTLLKFPHLSSEFLPSTKDEKFEQFLCYVAKCCHPQFRKLLVWGQIWLCFDTTRQLVILTYSWTPARVMSFCKMSTRPSALPSCSWQWVHDLHVECVSNLWGSMHPLHTSNILRLFLKLSNWSKIVSKLFMWF